MRSGCELNSQTAAENILSSEHELHCKALSSWTYAANVSFSTFGFEQHALNIANPSLTTKSLQADNTFTVSGLYLEVHQDANTCCAMP
uniref:Uncharacterized protein n=1 Tax=Arundo donax TaxID=35708 RepID=A0A0A9GM70_ARUDO